ncbi:MAG: hypothetical protein GXX99_02685 [Clostridiales bacterium]|nr:hypothetical protein [Clostridiales bacterium]
MRPLWPRAFLGALCFAGWRLYLITDLTEPFTGFLRRGQPFGMLFVGMLGLFLLVLDLKQRARIRRLPAPEAGAGAGVGAARLLVALAAAAGLGGSAFLALQEGFRLHGAYAAGAGLTALSLLLLLPAQQGRRARDGAAWGLCMVPVGWSLLALLASHMANNTLAAVPENAFTVIGCGLLTLALYGEARRCALGCADPALRGTQAAAVFLTAAVLPQALLRALVPALSALFISRCTAIDLALIALIPWLWQRFAALERQALRQADTHIKDAQEEVHDETVPSLPEVSADGGC